MRPRGEPTEYLADATRIATLLTADPERGPVVAEEALSAALQLVPRRRRDSRLADVLLAQLVRRARTEATAAPDLPEQLAALRTLPRRQRAALVLRHYADLSEDRAAYFLDCSARAVSDLASRALRALPPEARADPHEWLDSIPSPRAAPPPLHRSLLRRILQPRLLRVAGVLTAVAVGVVAGIQVPELVGEPERPTRAEQLAEIRQVLEMREASLPFDPDDPGPGATPIFPVVDGVVGGSLWSVSGYRDPAGSSCLQLVVDYEFGRRRCLGPEGGPIRAIVDVDRDHDATFLSGTVAPKIDVLYFTGPGVSWMDVAIGPRERSERQPGFFGIALGDEYVAVDSREAGRDGGYEVLPGKLIGMDAGGRRVARLSVFLART